jgi:uncharacterized membrane protein
LTDGIFAIVMTLLVLELKVPVLANAANQELWHSFLSQKTVFISYIISFALLFVYWRAHNFTITILAKNIDIHLLNINGLFLLLVGLVPYSTHILGAYGNTQFGIITYSLNIIFIGLSLLAMRLYVEKAAGIENIERSKEQSQAALIRVMTPVTFGAIAIPISFISTTLSFCLLLFAVAYNFHVNAADLTKRLLGKTMFRKIFE